MECEQGFAGCPEGWTLHEDMCYKASENTATGDDAKVKCEAMQAVLAFVHSEDTARFLGNIMAGWG